MFYYLYKVTNLINGRLYIGVHTTDNMNDGYMGSGKVIKLAIKKHGLSNFKKEILEFFDNSEQMLNKEKEIISEELIDERNVYNLKKSGQGGFDFINNSGIPKFLGKKHTEQTKKVIGEKSKGRKHTDKDIQIMKKHNWAKRNPEAQRKHAIYAAQCMHKKKNAGMV